MRKRTTIFFVIALVASSTSSFAQSTAVGTTWNDPNSWSPIGVPTSGAVIIPAGITMNVTVSASFNGTIEVFGTLNIGFLVTLTMDASSSIQVYTNGSITATIVSFLTIGTNTEVITFFTPEEGPQAIDENGVDGPLPVKLIFFEVNAVQDKVSLNWATAQELNFDYFSIERSADGTSFTEIAQINGSGNSSIRVDYEYSDNFPLNGLSYYRIRSIDFDGFAEVFDVAMVHVENIQPNFTIFPNPVEGGKFTLLTNFTPEKPLELVIYNNVGRIEIKYVVSDWHNIFELNNMQAGNYLLKLATPSGVMVKRIVIR